VIFLKNFKRITKISGINKNQGFEAESCHGSFGIETRQQAGQ